MLISCPHRVAAALACAGLLAVPGAGGAQPAAPADPALLGSWSYISTGSGLGVLLQFDLRRDGTYEYLGAFRGQVMCGGKSAHTLTYRGTFRVAGDRIAFVPASGRMGCTEAMQPIPHGKLGSLSNLGNQRDFFRLQGNELCLRKPDEDKETCFARAGTQK
jgi:hypothetical protein